MLWSPRSISLTGGVSFIMTLTLAVFSSVSPAVAQAAAEYGSVAGSSSAASLTTFSKKLNSTVSSPQNSASIIEPDKHTDMAAPSDSSIQDTNRREIERHAGENAAKLSFKSVPAKAVVRIDGKPVGQTPLLLSLAPGTYKVEMEGPRMEFGKQQLTVGAKEAREIGLRLSAAPRYPSRIRLQ